jgi:hypothetical protein
VPNGKLNKPQTADAALQKKRRRGNYWEVTYKKLSPISKSWRLSEDELHNDTGKENVEITADPRIRSVNLSRKNFRTCDFNHFTLDDSSFRDCEFVDCLFVKSDFDTVKFSRCRFDTCHFLYATFRNCQFLDCTFSNISASAETVLFEDTSISASAFLDALVTNTNSLPADVSKDYQQYRHVKTKAKIARAIFLSVRDQPELDQMFDANRSFEIALRRRKIEQGRWKELNKSVIKRSVIYRLTVVGFHKTALWLIQTAGFLTDWGRLPFRSVWLLASAVTVFTLVYYFAFGEGVSHAALRALDCSFVFGYTKYAAWKQGPLLDYITFVNTFVGLCWYALFFPALSKRLFR